MNTIYEIASFLGISIEEAEERGLEQLLADLHEEYLESVRREDYYE